MERERPTPPLPETPFYDNEDFDAPEASKEDVGALLKGIERLKAAVPKPEYFEQARRKNDIETADMETMTFLAALDPRDESSIALYKDFAEERVMEDKIATIEFSPEKQGGRIVGFHIYPDKIKRFERQEFDRSDIEPTEDVEEWLDRAAPKVAEHPDKEAEARVFREMAGMDFVSRKTAGNLRVVIRKYTEKLLAPAQELTA